VRVGFASAFFSEGTVGMYFRRWIERLDRTRFEVTIYNLRRGVNPFLNALAAKADRVMSFDGPALAPSALAPAIRDGAQDVLVYPELGMDGTSFVLAALRLAPVQCAAWGHPVTTGHSTIDAYFTCAAMEPADADSHYTERLVQLSGIGTEYARPAMPEEGARAQLGLPDATPLWLCPQSLFKIHPANDTLFARALARVPAAKLVMFEGRHPALTAKFLARLGAACDKAGVVTSQRVIVLKQCSHPDYLRINAVCDAMLDTLHWSGGNTSLDALACRLPIVTLPGRFMRGRQSAAMLELAGAAELIVHDEDAFVELAARLATDRRYRDSMSERIEAGHARIFEDPAPVDAFASNLYRLAAHGAQAPEP
jgi:CRISPR-associated protein Csy1